MRVLILSQWFQPEPMFKGLPLAKALRDRGHTVEVLTGFPNYPGGKLYPGYRVKLFSREAMDGVRVNRTALFPSHDRSTAKRMINYLSFSASAAAIGPLLVKKPDVIYVYNLITLGLAARLLRLFHGAKIVVDVQDLWPESVSGSGMMRDGLLTRLLSRWCRSEYLAADRLIVLSPGFKRKLIERGVPEGRIDLVYNWCDETPPSPPSSQTAAELGFAGRFNVVFAGTMGAVQSLDVVIDAAKRLRSTASDVLFTLVGGGIDVDRLKTSAADLPNIQFLSRRPQSEVGEIYANADALLVHLKRDPLFTITIPSKIQAYLHAGRPILCGVEGDAADLVTQAGGGLPFAPDNGESLATTVLDLRRMEKSDREEMGAAGRRFYLQQLSLDRGVDRIEQSLKAACHAPPRTAGGRAAAGELCKAGERA